MKLNMVIAGKLVDSTAVTEFQLHNPGYVLALKNQMEEDNADIIDLSKEKPSFFIDEVPSRMNGRGLLSN